MTLFRRIFARAADQHGYVTAEDALAEGGTPMALVMLAHRGTIEHVDRGLYRVRELGGDPMAQYQEALLRLPGAVLSHDTALEIENLADVNPRKVHVTMPKGYRLRKAIPAWIAVHQGEIGPAEVTEHDGLDIVTPVRAIIDAIEDDLGDRFVEQAFVTARKRNLLTTLDEKRIRRVQARHRGAHTKGRG